MNFERKAQIDSEQLSKLDYEIKYWTYSVWRIEAWLKGRESSESGYPLRPKTSGWEHPKTWHALKCEPNLQKTVVQQGVAEHLTHMVLQILVLELKKRKRKKLYIHRKLSERQTEIIGYYYLFIWHYWLTASVRKYGFSLNINCNTCIIFNIYPSKKVS